MYIWKDINIILSDDFSSWELFFLNSLFSAPGLGVILSTDYTDCSSWDRILRGKKTDWNPSMGAGGEENVRKLSLSFFHQTVIL